ncbi:hypothetical protein E2320_022329 [Naja naja]|nr:hypothetical protein E2320_022329 [Naja naja]
MEALCSSEEMLTKATQLWTMLDDMAENNPKTTKGSKAALCSPGAMPVPEDLHFVGVGSQLPSHPRASSVELAKWRRLSDNSEICSILDGHTIHPFLSESRITHRRRSS